ncbi:MAG: hypothetical protein ACYS0E_21690 [Planctomycetota bacterium]|jgi:hypothetical protein
MKSLVLCLALLGGCNSWNVDAFGYHMQASDKYQTKSTSGSSSMSTEEKWGVVLILGVAIGAGIAVAAAAN